MRVLADWVGSGHDRRTLSTIPFLPEHLVFPFQPGQLVLLGPRHLGSGRPDFRVSRTASDVNASVN